MNHGKIILAGGSGFLGTSLARFFRERGYDDIVNLTRSSGPSDLFRQVTWDGRTLGPWQTEFDGALAVINFAGRNVNCRYNARNRREIVESRVDSVRVIDRAIANYKMPPKVLIQAATLAILGDAGSEPRDESASTGVGFSPDVARAWESAFNGTTTLDTRRVLLRISFALDAAGGALGTLAGLAKCFLGGPVGTGRQYISWIHIADLCRLILWCIENENARGLYNATAPNAVTNAEFMRELRRALHRPWNPPAPAWAVKLGSIFMRTESELALWGRNGIPKRLLAEGFRFDFDNLHNALQNIYPKS